jgi:hypothetical protein
MGPDPQHALRTYPNQAPSQQNRSRVSAQVFGTFACAIKQTIKEYAPPLSRGNAMRRRSFALAQNENFFIDSFYC